MVDVQVGPGMQPVSKLHSVPGFGDALPFQLSDRMPGPDNFDAFRRSIVNLLEASCRSITMLRFGLPMNKK